MLKLMKSFKIQLNKNGVHLKNVSFLSYRKFFYGAQSAPLRMLKMIFVEAHCVRHRWRSHFLINKEIPPNAQHLVGEVIRGQCSVRNSFRTHRFHQKILVSTNGNHFHLKKPMVLSFPFLEI